MDKTHLHQITCRNSDNYVPDDNYNCSYTPLPFPYKHTRTQLEETSDIPGKTMYKYTHSTITPNVNKTANILLNIYSYILSLVNTNEIIISCLNISHSAH